MDLKHYNAGMQAVVKKFKIACLLLTMQKLSKICMELNCNC